MARCTAPVEGHRNGSKEQRDCPACGRGVNATVPLAAVTAAPTSTAVEMDQPTLAERRRRRDVMASLENEQPLLGAVGMSLTRLSSMSEEERDDLASRLYASIRRDFPDNHPDLRQMSDQDWGDARLAARVRLFTEESVGEPRSVSDIKATVFKAFNGSTVRKPKGVIFGGGKVRDQQDAAREVSEMVTEAMAAAQARAGGKISDRDYDRLTYNFRRVVGRIHPDDSDIDTIAAANWAGASRRERDITRHY